ncbi:MAG: FG-GAP-like repeat-containing protein [Planctomycetota bacterium]
MTLKTHPTSHMSVAALLGPAASLTAQSTPFGSAQVITKYTSAGAHSVNAADLDGDGDMDTIHSHFFDGTVTWCENLDGRGSFGPQNPVTLAANGATDAYAADMDGDGDMDVISASFHKNTVA